MPNRIIKESICTSDNIDGLTLFQEVVFYRLIVNCDDFGRFDARAKLLSSKLFPLRDISTDEIESALNALCKADLITLYMHEGRRYLYVNKWMDHQQRRSDKSKYPDPEGCERITTNEVILDQPDADDGNCNQMISNDIKCNQDQSEVIIFPRNRNRDRNTIIDNRYRESNAHTREDDDNDLHQIAQDHSKVLTAASSAGFALSDGVCETLIKLYAVYGMEKMLYGINACMRYGKTNIAYLEACLSDEPKKPKQNTSKKTVSAQQYAQRDYTGEQEDAMQRMIALGKGEDTG